MKYQNKKNKGFTLIEIMVAIAVFSIVMVMAMGALLNVIDSNNKARSIKTAINNISFALEGISKDVRMGTDYSCSDNSGTSLDCSSGGSDISFKSSKTIGGVENPYVYYKFSGNQIWSCVGGATSGVCPAASYSPLTSSEVTISATSSKFYVLGVADSKAAAGTRTQPRVIIVINGVAGYKERTKTTFDLQTSISQASRIKI